MGHDHSGHAHATDDRRLAVAVAVNLLLTLGQIVGGMLAGSLSLIADAVHNLGDAAALAIALFARRIGRRPPDALRTFGYKRAEVVAALVNLVSLAIVGIYLIHEAVWRLVAPEPVEGWIVVVVAGAALAVDVATAMLTYAQSRHSMNMRAAFLHNLSDALASVGVMIAGACILLYGWHWMDALLALLIAAYVLWQAASMLPRAIHLLMEGAPPGIALDDIVAAMAAEAGVAGVHHLHLWQLDEHRSALEAHVVTGLASLAEIEGLKARLKSMLRKRFAIGHSTLEFETPTSDCGR